MKTKSVLKTFLAMGTLFSCVSALAVEKKMEVPASDVTFAKKAAMGGMLEVELGKIATKNGGSAEVKEFGQMMVTDHTKANDQLKAIAGAQHIPLPDKLDAKHQAMVDKISKLEGAAFDKVYVPDMVEDHEKDLKEFKTEAGQSTNEKLKSFADETSAVIQKHLDKIKMIKASMK